MTHPTIAELGAALASGKTTSVALVEEALARIDDHRKNDGKAYVAVDAGSARAAAKAADQMRAAGMVPSPLAGLPVSIKDLFDVKGQVTRAGSKALDRDPAQTDSAAVARLRAAGAILLGRTNMSEFAFSGLGFNPHYGTPVTPLDGTRVSGGSTSGGAVSVALGMAAAALGTDTGGSIRIPSTFCGLVGFKPTARRVPMDGAVPLSTSLDSGGPLARSVACCAAVDAVLSGETLDSRPAPLAGLRLAVVPDIVMDDLEPEVASAFQSTIDNLSRQGAHIVDVPFPELRRLPEINKGGGFPAAESWHWHKDLLASRAVEYDPLIAARIKRGMAQTAADYIDLLNQRRALQAAAARRLRDVDAWLMPAVAARAPTLASLADEKLFFAINALVLRNPAVVNFLNGCAVSLPLPGGKGISLGICGLANADARVLQVAGSIEAAHGGDRGA